MRNKVAGIMTLLSDNNIDVALIQETWLKKSDKSIISEIKDFGYNTLSFRKPRRADLGGGVAVLSKSHLSVSRVPSKQKYVSFEHIECLVKTKEKLLRFVNIYRTEYSMKHKVTANTFLEEFSDYIGQALTKPGELIIVGDYNFHVERCDTDNEAANFMKMLDTHNIHQLVSEPTHVYQGTLDLVMTVNKDLIRDLQVTEDRLESDHFPIFFSVTCTPLAKSDKIHITTRNYNNIDLEKFKLDLQNSVLNHPSENLSLDEAVDLYNTTLEDILELHCPLEHKTVRPRPLQKWFTDDLKTLKRNKRKAERKWKKSRSPTDKESYDEVKKQYNQAIKMSRINYYRQSLLKDKHDIKRTFKIINKLTGDDFNTTLPTQNDDQTLANDMTTFFANKIGAIRSEIENNLEGNNTSNVQEEHHITSLSEMSDFSPITDKDLRKMVSDMSNKFNPTDPIPTSLLRNCMDELSPMLLMIVNKSLGEASFPSQLKHGMVRPVIKDNDEDPEDFKNYRPISNTPFLSKLLEKAALSQLNDYLEKNNLHSVYQSGYKKHHSCETALLKITNDMMNSIHNNDMVALILLDLSAAFDTVDHKILINKLKKQFGISGNALTWLTSYLSNRTYCVAIRKQVGKRQFLYFGVPQGSLLGPLLFILYTNELADIAKKHGLSIHIYADDTQIYIGFKPLSDHADTMKRIECCLMDIKRWMQANFLKLNVNKTEVLLIGSKTNTKLHRSIKINYDGLMLQSPQEAYVKTLGVKVDNNLTMAEQVQSICKACYFHLRNIGRIKRCLDTELRILLVKTFILSKLDYCNSILANISDGLIRQLQRVQNASVRFIYDVKRMQHITEYIKMAHFLPVKFRIQYKLCLIVHKITNGLCPEYLKDMIYLRQPTQNFTRSQHDDRKLSEKDCSNDISDKMVKYWNALPYNIRCISKTETFKKHLKTHYFDIAFNEQ